MKKMSLLLCACAVAVAGLLTSCSEPKEVVFDTAVRTQNAYSVTGTMSVENVAGATGSLVTKKVTGTITNGYVDMYYTDSKADNSEKDWYGFSGYSFYGTYEYSETDSGVTTTTTTKNMNLYNSELVSSFRLVWNGLTCLDGNYYIHDDSTYIPVTVSSSLSDDTFSISYTYVDSDASTSDYTDKTTSSWSLKFTKVGSN